MIEKRGDRKKIDNSLTSTGKLKKALFEYF
jgi:hypothetical protein